MGNQSYYRLKNLPCMPFMDDRQAQGTSGADNLSELVSRVMRCIVPRAMDSKSCVISDIPAKLTVSTDLGLVAAVLDGMLSFAVEHARLGYTRLSAKVKGNVVLVYVINRGIIINNAMELEVGKLNAVAERIMGSVSIQTEPKNASILTFGFPNLPLVG
jgi:hypothetical protein